VEHAIMGARDGPFGGCGRPVGEELLDLKAEVRERFLKHAQEANDIVTTAGLPARGHELGIGGPRISVAITDAPTTDAGSRFPVWAPSLGSHALGRAPVGRDPERRSR
jgi:hypothetical protein